MRKQTGEPINWQIGQLTEQTAMVDGRLRIVIMWPGLGEYHLARLRSVVSQCPEFDVVAMETVGGYERARQPGFRSLRRDGLAVVTLFPDHNADQLAPDMILRELKPTLNRLNPDAIAVCGYRYFESKIAIEWGRRNRRAVLLMCQSKKDDAPRRLHREAAKERIVRLCDAVLAGGTPQREYAAALGMPADRIFTGYSAVGNDEFERAAQAARAAGPQLRGKLGLGERPFFVASNRFIARKNLPGLVIAYSGYRAAVGNDEAWSLVLMGDGPDRPALQEHIAKLGVQGVILPGYRRIGELSAFYGLASCFVHPALQDQWGLVVNEAMACGLPVLVSRTAGCRYDLVEEGANGWTFDPASIPAMTEALLRIHRLPEEQRSAMGRRSREIVARWSPDRFAEALRKTVSAGMAHARIRKRTVSLIDRLILRAWI